jgi:hypothetical protein
MSPVPKRALSPQQRWAKKHRDRMRAACRLWRRRHPERQRKAVQRWRNKNRGYWNSYMRRWRKQHPVNVRNSTRRRYLAIRRDPIRYTAHLAEGKRWREAHPEQERSRARRYRRNNRAKVRAYHRKWMRAWYADNRNKARHRLRLRRARNPLKWRAYDRRIYRTKIRSHPGKYKRKLAQGRSWVRRNPLKQRHRVGLYRARTMMAHGSHTFKQWMARVKALRWRCYYCNSKLNVRTLTKDHRVPLSKGGTDFSTNLVPACKSCNSGKQDREWKPKSRER